MARTRRINRHRSRRLHSDEQPKTDFIDTPYLASFHTVLFNFPLVAR
jgi:hypothetical protein